MKSVLKSIALISLLVLLCINSVLIETSTITNDFWMYVLFNVIYAFSCLGSAVAAILILESTDGN